MTTRLLPMTFLLGGSLALAGPPAEKWSGDSLYQLRSTWSDAQGKKVGLDSLAGHPVLLAMIYTSCQASCPLTLSEMKAIERKLQPATRAGARFVVVSFDPARDTPTRLAQVQKEHSLSTPGWVLLTGNEEGVRDLAAALGFRYQPIGGGDFSHTNLLTVLGRDGAIRVQLSGIGQDPAPLLRALETEAATPEKQPSAP